MAEPIERNLGLDLVRVTETAAIGAARWLGRGDKEAVDQAAVDGMRLHLSTMDIDGVVVIGEGEKDEAPMLFNGEKVGSGSGMAVDVAVDPVDGTTLTASGLPNAIAVIALAEATDRCTHQVRWSTWTRSPSAPRPPDLLIWRLQHL